jgi:hypothetical protein
VTGRPALLCGATNLGNNYWRFRRHERARRGEKMEMRSTRRESKRCEEKRVSSAALVHWSRALFCLRADLSCFLHVNCTAAQLQAGDGRSILIFALCLLFCLVTTRVFFQEFVYERILCFAQGACKSYAAAWHHFVNLQRNFHPRPSYFLWIRIAFCSDKHVPP